MTRQEGRTAEGKKPKGGGMGELKTNRTKEGVMCFEAEGTNRYAGKRGIGSEKRRNLGGEKTEGKRICASFPRSADSVKEN